MNEPYNIVCERCGTEAINFDATAVWNKESQEMELYTTFPEANCSVCNEQVKTLHIDLENFIHLSMSDLLKKSAKQLCYLRLNPLKEREPSQQMLDGNLSAEQKSTSKFIEMRGTYRPDKKLTHPLGQFLMHYAFDEILVTDSSVMLIEHKNVKDPSTVETWYLHSSILQTAVYQALVKRNPDTNLHTETFYVKEGHEKLHLNVKNLYVNSELHIGTDKYTIIVTEPGKLIEFYIQKTIASFDYRTADIFDANYKHKEYDVLKKHFTFRPIQE
jgi:hypothetical protein